MASKENRSGELSSSSGINKDLVTTVNLTSLRQHQFQATVLCLKKRLQTAITFCRQWHVDSWSAAGHIHRQVIWQEPIWSVSVCKSVI